MQQGFSISVSRNHLLLCWPRLFLRTRTYVHGFQCLITHQIILKIIPQLSDIIAARWRCIFLSLCIIYEYIGLVGDMLHPFLSYLSSISNLKYFCLKFKSQKSDPGFYIARRKSVRFCRYVKIIKTFFAICQSLAFDLAKQIIIPCQIIFPALLKCRGFVSFCLKIPVLYPENISIILKAKFIK